MPFGVGVKPRLAPTSRACRAIIAARESGPELGEAALRALQLMQFTTTGLLDDDDDLLAALSTVPGLNAEAVVGRIDDPDLISAYESDRACARTAEGKPTHVQSRHADTDGKIRFTAPSVIFEHPGGERLEVGGFQPFEAYDTALANLEPSLARRRPPASAAEALAAFPRGLATAEVASILRAELDESDIAAAQKELIELAGGGGAICEPAGADAIWRPLAQAPQEAPMRLAPQSSTRSQ